MHPCLETPSIRGYSPQDRIDLEKIFDLSMDLRTDEAVQRTLESEQRRRQKIWFMPHAGGGMFRPHIFRALFQKDIGGVAGVSDSWFDADLYTVDGGSGKVRSFANYIDQTQILNQPAAGAQVAVPAADVAFNNAKTVVFDRIVQNAYVSNQTAAFWRFWQDGTGVEIFLVYAPRSTSAAYYVSTRAGVVVNENGGLLGVFSANTIRASWTNGVATFIDSGNVGTTVVGTATYQNFSYIENGLPTEYALRLKGSSVASGNSTAAPNTGDPQSTLVLGSGTGGLSDADMLWRSLYICRRVFSTVERTVAQQFIQSQTAITP